MCVRYCVMTITGSCAGNGGKKKNAFGIIGQTRERERDRRESGWNGICVLFVCPLAPTTSAQEKVNKEYTRESFFFFSLFLMNDSDPDLLLLKDR